MLVQISSEIYLNKSSKFLNSLVRNYGQFIKKNKNLLYTDRLLQLSFNLLKTNQNFLLFAQPVYQF